MLFLCIKIFRRKPHLAPNIVKVLGDISNCTESRASLKRKAQAEKYQKTHQNKCIKKEAEVVDLTTATATAAANNRNTKQVIWAKVHMAKAMQESANVARRLGKIEATEKNQYIGQDPAFYR
jgi:predicted nucleic acid-binding protein